MRPLIQFKENNLLKNMILKAEEYIVEFKQKLVQDKIFEIPTYMQDLQYILKGLIGIFENQSQISENF